MPDGTPKFTGYTPATYTPSSIDWTQFATPLQQMQQSFDLAEQAIYETQFDFSALDADQERAKEIEQEFAGFKESLTEDLLKTKDYRNAVRELRRANKIYNEDKEITLYKSRKAERDGIEATLNKWIEDGTHGMTEEKKQEWLTYLDLKYREQGGANYNRETGTYNSSPFKMRSEDREQEMLEFANKLAKDENEWADIDKSKTYQMLDPKTKQELEVLAKRKFKNGEEISKDLYRILSESDYFKSALEDDYEARYFLESRNFDAVNDFENSRGYNFAKKQIKDFAEKAEVDAADMEKLANNTELSDVQRANAKKQAEKSRKTAEEYNAIYERNDVDEIRRIGQNLYISDNTYNKIKSISGGIGDLHEYVQTTDEYAIDLSKIGSNKNNGKGGTITSDDINNNLLNIEKSRAITTTVELPESSKEGQATVYTVKPGEMAIPFVEERFGGKDYTDYLRDYELSQADLQNDDLPISTEDLPTNFLEMGISPESMTFLDVNLMDQYSMLEQGGKWPWQEDVEYKQNDFESIAEYDKERLVSTRTAAKIYTASAKYYKEFTDEIYKLSQENEQLRLNKDGVTNAAEIARIDYEINQNNKKAQDLNDYVNNVFAGKNASLRKGAKLMKEAGEGSLGYDQEFIDAVVNQNYQAAYERLAKVNRENYLYMGLALTDPERATALSNAIQDPKKREQINRAGVTVGVDIAKEILYNSKAKNGVIPLSGLILDEKASKYTEGYTEELGKYAIANINNIQNIQRVKKIRGGEVEYIKSTEETGNIDIKGYGSPVMIGSSDGVALLKFTRTAGPEDKMAIAKNAKSYWLAQKTLEVGSEVDEEKWNELTKTQRDAFVNEYQSDNPIELIVGVSASNHLDNIKSIADNKFVESIQKYENAVVENTTFGGDNSLTGQFLGTTLATKANFDFATDLKLKNEYEEVGQSIAKIARNKKGSYDHPSSPPHQIDPNDPSKGYFAFRINYVFKDGSIQAQVYQDIYDSEGRKQTKDGEKPFDYYNITGTKGTYAENVRLLDLYYGTGGSNVIMKVGKNDIIPAFRIYDRGAQPAGSNKPTF